MDYPALTVVAAFAFVYSLFASRLERTPINGALVYVLVGYLCSSVGLIEIGIGGEGLRMLAEIALALVLFTDSAKTNLVTLRIVRSIPTRLLLIGLPLTIGMGIVVGYVLFPEWDFFELALLATMLAPTDAALGKAVVTNEAVPDSVRESLNVESGLNDGIAVPVLLFFIAIVSGETDTGAAAQLVVQLPLQAIGVGVVVGIATGTLGSHLLRICSVRGWLSGTWIQLPVITLTFFSFGAAQSFGGSGFIACFVAGLFFGALAKRHKQQYLEAAEGIGDLLALVTWFVCGAAAIGLTWEFLDWRVFAYALASLTIVRMLPVFLSVVGMQLRWDTTAFIGWFGPRGLASIVFAVMVRSENLPHSDLLLATVTWTILMSVLLHGVTANPLAGIYGKRVCAEVGTSRA